MPIHREHLAVLVSDRVLRLGDLHHAPAEPGAQSDRAKQLPPHADTAAGREAHLLVGQIPIRADERRPEDKQQNRQRAIAPCRRPGERNAKAAAAPERPSQQEGEGEQARPRFGDGEPPGEDHHQQGPRGDAQHAQLPQVERGRHAEYEEQGRLVRLRDVAAPARGIGGACDPVRPHPQRKRLAEHHRDLHQRCREQQQGKDAQRRNRRVARPLAGRGVACCRCANAERGMRGDRQQAARIGDATRQPLKQRDAGDQQRQHRKAGDRDARLARRRAQRQGCRAAADQGEHREDLVVPAHPRQHVQREKPGGAKEQGAGPEQAVHGQQ
jgi:hypothetical protein